MLKHNYKNISFYLRYYSCTSSNEPIISSSRTDITAKLWKHRVNKDLLDEAKKKSLEKQNEKDLPSFLINKKPSDSYVSIDLNFQSNPILQEQYQSWNKSFIRFGKILEDLDALAGNIAHSHADDNNPQTRPLQIVTACVDRIDMLRKFPLTIDLTIRGNVSYVGRSSMHINVEVVEKNKPDNYILTSSFLMVAKDENTKKTVPVNHLEIESDKDKIQWIDGENAKKIRKNERAISLTTTPPTSEELLKIHSLILENNDNSNISSSNIRKIKSTLMSSITITQPQEKNTKDKIFGGYLMRKAYELGMATTLKFCGSYSNPYLLAIDEVSFHRPVEIGSIIQFDAYVIYTTTKACQIKVETRIHDLHTDKQFKSNSFHFTFATTSSDFLPSVIPETYLEAMDYIDGKRRLEGSYEHAKRQNSTLLSEYL